MLGVPPPCAFNEGDWCSHFFRRSAAFQDVVEIVPVAVRIDPPNLLARPGGARPLFVEVETVLIGEVLQKRLNKRFAVFANELAEFVSRSFTHESPPHPEPPLVERNSMFAIF